MSDQAELQAALDAVTGTEPTTTDAVSDSSPAAVVTNGSVESPPQEILNGSQEESQKSTSQEEGHQKESGQEEGSQKEGIEEKGISGPWANVLRQQAQIRREKVRIEKQTRASDQHHLEMEQQRRLMQENPVAWAQQHGGSDFYNRMTTDMLRQQGVEPEAQTVDSQVATLRQELQQLRQEQVQREQAHHEEQTVHSQNKAASDYMGEVRNALSADGHELTRAWPGVEDDVANLVVAWKEEYGEILTPGQAIDKISSKVRDHYTRLSQAATNGRGNSNGAVRQSPRAITNQAASLPVEDAPADLPWDEQLAIAARNLARGG